MTDREPFSFDRLASAVLVLLRESRTAPSLTVLLKMLWKADSRSYCERLRSITGLHYVAIERGPVPDSYREVIQKLEARGYIRREFVDVGLGHPRQDFFAARSPNVGALSERDVQILTEVAKSDGHRVGTALSDETHEELPWRAVYQGGDGDGQRIPYGLTRWEANRCGPEDLRAAEEDLRNPEIQAFLSSLT